eukprot:Nitzschia sp. Nitz4//scaffold230_size58257//32794//35800//NITZ4_006484-RA/size58257-augustus-gene-0.11-mRNA-1//-1//CDS//3329543259//8018//frame0
MVHHTARVVFASRFWRGDKVLFILHVLCSLACGFCPLLPWKTAPPAFAQHHSMPKVLQASVGTDHESVVQPQVFANGFSESHDLETAVREATTRACKLLPPLENGIIQVVDLAMVSVSSLYEETSSLTTILPTLTEEALSAGYRISRLVGSTASGIISSTLAPGEQERIPQCVPMERERVPAISVLFAILPDVQVQTFHLPAGDGNYLPNLSEKRWRETMESSKPIDPPSNPENQGSLMMLIPTPSFEQQLNPFIMGARKYLRISEFLGVTASTVSSSSRPRLLWYDSDYHQTVIQKPSDLLQQGCVGVCLQGDIQLQTLVATGEKPVGGVYEILQGKGPIVGAVQLEVPAAKKKTHEPEDEVSEQKKPKWAQDATLMRMPRPALVEANFVMRTLGDDDYTFMQQAILVGLQRNMTKPVACNNTNEYNDVGEIARLSEGAGHTYQVHQVVSASKPHGTITLPFGSVNVKPGQRMQFFVRDEVYARKEVEAVWQGYHQRRNQHFPTWTPSACLVFPCESRGNNFFFGESNWESGIARRYLPDTPSISGFFVNSVTGSLEPDRVGLDGVDAPRVFKSSTAFVLVGSRSKRPRFVPNLDSLKTTPASVKEDGVDHCPYDENGELIVQRRDLEAGRAMTVGPVAYSVAQKEFRPRSMLEHWVWEKCSEVDNFRERVPLSNWVSQLQSATEEDAYAQPRDFVRPIQTTPGLTIIPETKKREPREGCLRFIYHVEAVVKDFEGAHGWSVNCDPVLYGGCLEDVQSVRQSSSNVPPLLASDLFLYPYQLYKVRLAGADAVTLWCGALTDKELVYLCKIASKLGMQTVAVVTSEYQVTRVQELMEANGMALHGLIVSNRRLEDMRCDDSGKQALSILTSSSCKSLQETKNLVLLVEGGVGRIRGGKDHSVLGYMKELYQEGANGVVIGRGMVKDDEGDTNTDSFSVESDRWVLTMEEG